MVLLGIAQVFWVLTIMVGRVAAQDRQTPESLQAFPLKINPELFFDTLMMEIRRSTILYSAQEKRERNALEQLLNHDIEILENQIRLIGILPPLVK